MFELQVRLTFDAAHHLREYKGKCENLHGHNWKVDIFVESDTLNKEGMAIDFHDIKKIASNILEELDHKYLNEHEYFKTVNPTSENIAKYIYDCLDKEFLNVEVKLKKVSVWETDTSCASYIK
jgi:6-pyruvoyltetrahydropterin/6-carboxytetrahydropterin synthase